MLMALQSSPGTSGIYSSQGHPHLPMHEHRFLWKEGIFQLQLLLSFPGNCMCGLLSYFHSKLKEQEPGVKQAMQPWEVSEGWDGFSGEGSWQVQSNLQSSLCFCSPDALCVFQRPLSPGIKPGFWGPFLCRIQTATWFGGSHNNSSIGLDDSSTQEPTNLASDWVMDW